ncbi:MAG: hypothetical protein K0U34_07435 [Alphaproteobacteria bacterium]|nr:hypothetical protein [Alphaproteobacteria bacterium]
MFETIIAIFGVSSGTTYLIAGLTAACSVFFLHMTNSRALTLLFTPVAAIGALTGVYVSRELGLYYSTDKDSNILLSGILGLAVSLVIVILTARLGYMITNAIRSWQAAKLHQNK